MTQKESIKQYLLTGKTLTPLECLQKGWGLRLGARIWDLRHEGYKIENVGADDANYAVYRMYCDEADDTEYPCDLPAGHTGDHKNDYARPAPVAAPVLPTPYRLAAPETQTKLFS